MKKRLLALALCLVMMTSLLPVMAYGENPECGLSITGSGFEKNAGGGYVLKENQSEAFLQGVPLLIKPEFLTRLYQDSWGNSPMTDVLVDGGTYYLKCRIESPDFEGLRKLVDYLDASNCSLVVPGFTASFVRWGDFFNTSEYGGVDIFFQVTKNRHEHQWQYTTAENSLKAKCYASGCDIGEVSVTITARSVTLPAPPFNAELKFEGDFKEVFHCSEIEYQYEDPTTGWGYVDPNTFTPKPGNYQAGVLISGLPGNGGVATRAVGNDDGTNQGGSVYLFVKYTAVDPAVTAQTGDNRPIEIMMAGVVVFSALAAAAFIADSKRRSHQ